MLVRRRLESGTYSVVHVPQQWAILYYRRSGLSLYDWEGGPRLLYVDFAHRRDSLIISPEERVLSHGVTSFLLLQQVFEVFLCHSSLVVLVGKLVSVIAVELV